jgi:16S rRNA (cytosine1402-N4)-methyltransferase
MHKPVLLKESLEGLDLKPGEIFFDGTLGSGGHTEAVIERHPKVRVVGIDQDPEAIRRVGEKLKIETRLSNFRQLDSALKSLGLEKVDAILLDIGLSSDQLESSGRGFSFMKDEPLDMRMSAHGFTAADILNSWEEPAIELILRGFGEERYSRRIAAEIVARREVKPFSRTTELVAAIESAVPGGYKNGKINPATRTFQALRIAVNGELDALEEGLKKGFEALNPGGRLAVITFHSLEDRIVKNFFRSLASEERGVIQTKKPIVPTESEVKENPRSRSAKLRIIKKL